MKSNHMKEKGNITVEAAIIFPIIFFCIIAIMFVGIFLYQQTLLQSIADKAVERGATTWGNPSKDISTGKVSKSELNDGGLYWRIFDGAKTNKEIRLNSYISDRMDRYSILTGEHGIVSADLKNYVLYKKLFITVESSYKNPAAGIMKIFGYGEHIKIRVVTQSVINDPTEFIRNTDLVINLAEDLEESNPTVAKLGSNMREIMAKIKSSLNKVFE